MSSIPASDNDVSSSIDGKDAVDLENKSVTVDKKRKVRADDEESGDFNEESMPGDDEDGEDEDVDDEDGNDPEEHDDSDDDNQETVIILIGAKFLPICDIFRPLEPFLTIRANF